MIMDLGKVQGLFEPFIVTERGTISKEKLYIPKSLIKRYTDEILFFDITQQAKDYCMRTTPPSEYEAKGIVQIISETRSKEEEETKKEGKTRTDTQIVSVEEEIQRRRRRRKTSLSTVDINEEEIIKKIKTAGSEFK